MLEEKNDSLHNADGQDFNESENTIQNEKVAESEKLSDIRATEGQIVDANQEIFLDVTEDVIKNNDSLKEITNLGETEGQIVGIPDADIKTGTKEKAPKNQSAVDAIENSNAEENEDDSAKDRHDIPMQNYESFSMEKLTEEIEKLVASEKVTSIKEHVEDIKKEFYSKYNHFIDEKKDEYSHENNGDTTDFEYHFPLKNKFDSIYNQYRDKKNTHFKKLQSDLKGNLENRLAIIEELKSLIDSEDSIKDNLKSVNDLRERWKNAGSIPRDKYNHVWNNFHFHIERFYDHLHLDREARDIDFKHNLEQKQRIIARVEELVEEEDVNKAFRELQGLHKIWKEEIGPVSREHREDIWNRFSELTKQLHDKREVLFARAKEQEVENLKKKQEIISKIEMLATEKVHAHGAWQGQIDKIEALRNEFFQAGKVPIELNEDTWAAFKNAVRNFNALKNSFYKDIKKDQNENLNRKLALVEKAKSLQESEDFESTTPIMKQIQDDWKKIGHVPRKYSDSVWKDFKTACNNYFDRLHAQRNEANKEEIDAFEKKKEYLESIKDFELTGDHKIDLDAIKLHIENWKAIGRVPQARRHIEGKFNKILDALFDKLSLSKKETEMVKFSNRLEQLVESDDSRKLQNEQIFIMRKVDELQSEILQLENNIQFISNAKADNPFIKEINKNIERHKEDLKTWKDKLKQIRSLQQ